MQYDSQIKKSLKILQNENKNTIDANNLNKIEPIIRPENFRKEVMVIHLVKGYDINNGAGGTLSKNPLVTPLIGGPNIPQPTD